MTYQCTQAEQTDQKLSSDVRYPAGSLFITEHLHMNLIQHNH